MSNTDREQCYLGLGGTSISLTLTVLLKDFNFFVRIKMHSLEILVVNNNVNKCLKRGKVTKKIPNPQISPNFFEKRGAAEAPPSIGVCECVKSKSIR